MSPYYLVFGLIALASLAVSMGLSRLRRRVSRRGRSVCDINGTTFTLFASLYAFFLGFCVVTLWNVFGQAKAVVADEANALHAAAYFSREFNDSIGFRRALAAYLQSVVDEEWPSMNRRQAMHPRTRALAAQVWEAFRALQPEDRDKVSLYASLGDVLLAASQKRNTRELLLSGNIYPPVWVIIVFGFFGSCLALYSANPEQTSEQLLMEFVTVFTVLSCIYFIYDIDTPFSGVLLVSPEAFANVLDRLREANPVLLGG